MKNFLNLKQLKSSREPALLCPLSTQDNKFPFTEDNPHQRRGGTEGIYKQTLLCFFFPLKHLSSCRLLPLEAGTIFPLSRRFSGNLLLFVEDAVKAGVFSHRLECVSWILLPCDMTAHINRHAWSSSCSSVLYYRSLSQLRIYEDWGEITFLLPKKKLIHLTVDISGIWVAYYLLNSLVLFYRPCYFNLS